MREQVELCANLDLMVPGIRIIVINSYMVHPRLCRIKLAHTSVVIPRTSRGMTK